MDRSPFRRPLAAGKPGHGGFRHMAFVPGKVMVRFRAEALAQGTPPQAAADDVSFTALEAHVPEAIGQPLRFARRNLGLTGIRSILSAGASSAPATHDVELPWKGLGAGMRQARETRNALSEFAGIAVLDVSPGKEQRTVDALRDASGIAAVERMPARWLLARPDRAASAGLSPALQALRWDRANRPGTADCAIAVIDSGIDAGHPLLQQRIRSYHSNGFSKRDVLGHGTHVCGLISGQPHAGNGFRGMCDAGLHVWKVFDDVPNPHDGEFYLDNEAYIASLLAVFESGARVLNLSLGGTERSRQEADILKALHAHGVACMAAIGNEYAEGDPVEYPAAYPGVFAVGAIDENGRRAWFSNTGRHLRLVAPGTDMLSTVPMRRSKYRQEREFAVWDGTSMATPLVAAAAAMLRIHRPELDADGVYTHLAKAAVRLPAMRSGGYSPRYGYGRLDLVRLLGAARAAATASPPRPPSRPRPGPPR